MSGDLAFEELAPDSYPGTVERIRYGYGATLHVALTYKLETPAGEIRRIDERLPLSASISSAVYFRTVLGKGRVADILRVKGMSLADADAAGGRSALPELIEGVAIRVVTRNRRVGGFNCPIVVRIEPPA